MSKILFQQGISDENPHAYGTSFYGIILLWK